MAHDRHALPCARSSSTTRRLTAPLPQPVRTAHTATTGRAERSMVRRGGRIAKSAPGGEGAAREVHDVLVAHVAVREHHLVDAMRSRIRRSRSSSGSIGDAVGISRTGQRGWIAPAGDAGNLRGRERDHVVAPASRYTTLKLWKSRPAAPRITTRRGIGRVSSSRAPGSAGARCIGCASAHSAGARGRSGWGGAHCAEPVPHSPTHGCPKAQDPCIGIAPNLRALRHGTGRAVSSTPCVPERRLRGQRSCSRRAC